MKEIDDLADELLFLQGVGAKTANRYAYEFLESSEEQRSKIIDSILELKNIKKCIKCNNYSKEEICEICSDENRDPKTLVIVVAPKDILKIEKILPNKYYYYALGGVINPLDGIDFEFINISQIKNIITTNKVLEIILVLPTTQEGEITSEYLKNILNNYNITFSKIAQGVPIGGELEYLDELTLLRSIQKRQNF